MNTPEYSLEFESQPWSCKILQAGEPLLQILSKDQVLQARITEQGGEFAFQQASLEVQIQDQSVDFHWKGGPIQIQIPIQDNWYGGGALIHQLLRWNEIMLPLGDFSTDDNGPTGLTTNLTPAWLSSRGVGLRVLSPFQLGFNQPPARYLARQKGISPDLIPFDQRPFQDRGGQGDGMITLVGENLHFEILIERDLKAVYRALQKRYGKPSQTPPLELLGAPIWTTWARFKDRIDQETVLGFADEIRKRGYPYQVLEIDDRWQIQYGDLAFDPERFPDPKGMIRTLHQMGFKVTAWVIPFFHPYSETGQEAAQNGYLVQDTSGGPCRVAWWQGTGYLLDVTNPAALDWYQDCLESFQQEIGLDGYKFDAGEAKFVPSEGVFHSPLSSPNEYTHRYVAWISENFSFCEVRSGWLNQTSPIFFRLWDLWSTWGADNGLGAVIPSILSLGLTGYPFVFPDMIGGNAYFRFPTNPILQWLIHQVLIPILTHRLKKDSDHPEEETLGLSDVPGFLEKSVFFGYPTPELIIRWTQASVFLQVMQFSLAPWDFGQEADQICRTYAHLHLEFTSNLEKALRQAIESGDPAIRPVFWLAPQDERAFTCQDEFLVGNEILVAPVLRPGARSREIYFPPGSWQDYWTGQVHQGPAVVRDYPAPLDKLPFFLREDEK